MLGTIHNNTGKKVSKKAEGRECSNLTTIYTLYVQKGKLNNYFHLTELILAE